MELEIEIRDNQFAFTQEQRQKINEFKKENDNTKISFELNKLTELRTSQAFGYYRASILPAFVPEHFNTPQEAHLFFSDKFLRETTLIDLKEEGTEKLMQIIVKYASRSRNSLVVTRNNEIVSISWVRSTMALKRKEMLIYMNAVIQFGNEQGIEFQDSQKYKNKE